MSAALSCWGMFPKLASRVFCCWVVLRNNYMATNLQRFTSSYGGGCFAACDRWTQPYW